MRGMRRISPSDPDSSRDCVNMRSTTIRALAIATALIGMTGCQSGPRWAWWKTEDLPADTSLVARSAEPTLPSAQTTPQVPTADGLQPAASPSTANLAAAGAVLSTPIGAIPTTSSTTIANAPLANYPAIGSGAETAAAATKTSPGSPIAPATMPAVTPPTTAPAAIAAASVPAAGPYDPSAYQPGTSLATNPAASESSSKYDQYAMPTAGSIGASPSPTTPSAPAPGFAAESTTPVPYATSTASAATEDRYGSPSATGATTQASGVQYGQPTPDRYGPIATGKNTISPVAPLATSAVTSAGLPTPVGQYRPGGTSSYATSPATQHIEVATRPQPPTTSSAPTAGAATPGALSSPWSPPGTSLPATSGTGARTY